MNDKKFKKLIQRPLRFHHQDIHEELDIIKKSIEELKTMYEDLNCFEEALKHFGTRVDVIIAMEMARKITPEESYQQIKDEMKEVKKCRKLYKKEGC
jgi:hypothetical protein